MRGGKWHLGQPVDHLEALAWRVFGRLVLELHGVCPRTLRANKRDQQMAATTAGHKWLSETTACRQLAVAPRLSDVLRFKHFELEVVARLQELERLAQAVKTARAVLPARTHEGVLSGAMRGQRRLRTHL